MKKFNIYVHLSWINFSIIYTSRQSRPAMEGDLQVHPVVDHLAQQVKVHLFFFTWKYNIIISLKQKQVLEGLVLLEMVLLEAGQSPEWPMVLIVPWLVSEVLVFQELLLDPELEVNKLYSKRFLRENATEFDFLKTRCWIVRSIEPSSKRSKWISWIRWKKRGNSRGQNQSFGEKSQWIDRGILFCR